MAKKIQLEVVTPKGRALGEAVDDGHHSKCQRRNWRSRAPKEIRLAPAGLMGILFHNSPGQIMAFSPCQIRFAKKKSRDALYAGACFVAHVRTRMF
jgi:hypothetical protein